MHASNNCTIERPQPINTSLIFTVVGNGKNVFQGNSNSLSRNCFIFETDTSLCLGMLLQIKLSVAAAKNLGLQALVKVIAINQITGSNNYQISSAIEEMALKI